jgi:iron complex outermembrane receptor protein
MNASRPFTSLRLFLALGSALIVSAVAPREGVAQDTGGIEEIIVTAERREADIQDVPLAVSTYSTEQLDNLQITSPQDLQRYAPSLHMFNNITSPTNLSLSMRGGLQQDASLVVAESPIGIYVDDVYVGRLNGNNVTFSDLERVEVLRGPQGTLYGRNTGYGALKYISRIPGEETWFDASAGVGNADQFVLKATGGGPLSDNWAGSLAVQRTTKDDQYFNLAEDTETGLEKSTAFRAKLHYTGSDRFDAVLWLASSNSDNDSLQMVNGVTPDVPSDCIAVPPNDPGCAPGQTAQFTTDDLVFPNGEYNVNTPTVQLAPYPLRDRPQGETDQTIAGLTLSYEINDNMTVKSITGYVGTEDYFHTDFSGNSAATFPPFPAGGFVGASDIDSDQFTEELQLLGTAIEDRLQFILGAFYLHEQADQRFGWHFFTPLSRSVIDTEVDSIALFGEAGYQVTEKLKVTAGLRWTDDSKDFTFDFERLAGNFFDIVVAPGFFPPFQERIVLDGDFDEWTPKLSADYALNDDILLYVQGAKGYKGGGFSAIALASTFPVGVYEPETNWTYEGGLKADWFGSRLRTNFAYFFSDIEDVQQNATVVGAGFEFPVENSGDAEIQGLEFEVIAVPLDGLNVFVSGSLMDGEYENLNPNSAAAAARTVYGVEPDTPQTPDYTITVGFDYTFDFPGDTIGDMSFGADYYEIDDYITAATNDFYNSGWDIWNGYVSADIGDNWEVKFSGKNLADDHIVTSGSRGLGGFILLPSREFLFTVTYRFAGTE